MNVDTDANYKPAIMAFSMNQKTLIGKIDDYKKGRSYQPPEIPEGIHTSPKNNNTSLLSKLLQRKVSEPPRNTAPSD